MKQPLKRYYRAILLMLLLPAMLAELISEATPAPAFFAPVTLLLFTFPGYGLPALMIRELAVRTHMRIAGIFILGFAYGIYNEGLIAKTLLMESGVPNPAFDHYSMFGGINTAWLTIICIYHAMCSVLFPILIVHATYPEDSQTPWFGKKFTCILAGILLIFATLAFLGGDKLHGNLEQLAFLLAFVTLCVLIALRLRPIEPPHEPIRKSMKPVFLGLIIIPLYILISAIADHKLPLVFFFAVLAVLATGYICTLKNSAYANIASLKLFAAGVYIGFTVFGSALRIAFHKDELSALATGIIATAILIWWIKKILKDTIPSP